MLNSYQIPVYLKENRQYGDKSAGNKTISGTESLSSVAKAVTSVGANYIGVASGEENSFAIGDQILLIQMRGGSADQTTNPNYEWKEVYSIDAVNHRVYFTENIQYSYTVSSSGKPQIVKVPMYDTITIPSGQTIQPTAWNGEKYGIEVILCDVFDGQSGGIINLNGLGFRKGNGTATRSLTGEQGEGTTNAGGTRTTVANGDGAGGGQNGTAGNPWASSGGGGGLLSEGDDAYNNYPGGENIRATPGSGGDIRGKSDFTIIVLGGAGAAGGTHGDSGGGSPASGSGGNSSAILIIFARVLTNRCTVSQNGNNGQNIQGSPSAPVDGAGGGGTGGMGLFAGNVVDIGTNLITAIAGTGGITGASSGGDGAEGALRAEYGTSFTGSTNNPVADTELNPELVPGDGNFLALF